MYEKYTDDMPYVYVGTTTANLQRSQKANEPERIMLGSHLHLHCFQALAANVPSFLFQ